MERADAGDVQRIHVTFNQMVVVAQNLSKRRVPTDFTKFKRKHGRSALLSTVKYMIRIGIVDLDDTKQTFQLSSLGGELVDPVSKRETVGKIVRTHYSQELKAALKRGQFNPKSLGEVLRRCWGGRWRKTTRYVYSTRLLTFLEAAGLVERVGSEVHALVQLCDVCDEVFGHDLKSCPVCGARPKKRH